MPNAPQQARSRRTMERIVTAALAIVAERGAEEATVQEIVQRARSSVGSFYSRFDGKDELMAYLQEWVWNDALTRWRTTLGEDGGGATNANGGAGAPEALREAVALVVSALLNDRDDDRLRRHAFGAPTIGAVPDVVAAFRTGVMGLVRSRLRPFEDAIGHPEPRRAIDLGFVAVAGAVRQMDAHPEIEVPAEDLATELERVYLAYLGGSAGGEGDATQFADPFDVWT